MEAWGKQLRRAEARQYALNGGKKEYEGGACCADDEPTAEYGLPQACANGSFYGFALPFPRFWVIGKQALRFFRVLMPADYKRC